MRRVILLSILLILPLLLTGCIFKKNKEPGGIDKQIGSASIASAVPLANLSYLVIDPVTVDESIQINRNVAAEKVKSWHEQASLYHFSVKVPANLEVGKATEVYTYGSLDDAYNWWTMNFSGKSGKSVRAMIPKEDYLGTDIQPIPEQFWKINYVQALQVADVSGGADYRKQYPAAEIVISLAVGEPKQYLWWVVEYNAPLTESLKILVNPVTKEAVNPSGILITAPQASSSPAP